MKYIKKCKFCSKLFEKNPYYSLKSWKDKAKFCSKKCYSSWQTINYKGKNNSNYKGGINFDGRYFRINVVNHPFADKWGRIYYHRYIVEQKLKRYLNPKETIHHINGNKSDNRLENLYLFKSHSIHMKFDNRWHKGCNIKSNIS